MKKSSLGVSARKTAAKVLFAFSLILPLGAGAGVKGGSFELSPFLGYNLFETSQNLNDNLIYGGRVSYNFSKVFGLEGTLEFANTHVHDKTLTGSREGQFRSPIDKVDLFLYHLDAVFTLNPDDDFNIFLLGGLGRVNYSPSIETGDMATYDLGIGAKYWLSENFALRLDVRDDMVTEVFHEGAVFKNSYQNVNAALGLVIAFGGETPKKVVAKQATPVPTAVPTAVVLYVAEEPKVEEKVAAIATQPPVVEETLVLAFEDAHFYYDKSTLSDKAKAVIKRTIQILKDNPKAHIRIAGYSSAAGTSEYNQKLSEKRARAVKNYLVQEGLVSSDRLTTIGFGETRPAEYERAPRNHYSTAAKANMRVLFEVIVK